METKIQERDEEGNLKWANQYLKTPLWKTVQVADDHVPAVIQLFEIS